MRVRLRFGLVLLVVVALHGCAAGMGTYLVWTEDLVSGKYEKLIKDFRESGGYKNPTLATPWGAVSLSLACEAFYELGQLNQADECLNKLYNHSAERPAIREVARTYNKEEIYSLLRAKINIAYGNYPEALRLAKVAIQIAEQQFAGSKNHHKSDISPYYLIQSFGTAGLAAAKQGMANEARSYANSILRETRYYETKSTQAYYWHDLRLTNAAKIFMALGDYQSALNSFSIPFEGGGGTFEKITRGIFTLGISTVIETVLDRDGLGWRDQELIPKQFIAAKSAYELGKLTEAREQYDFALRSEKLKEFAGIYPFILNDRAIIAIKDNDKALALKYLYTAVDEVEKQRSFVTNDTDKMGFVGDKQNIYKNIIELLVKMGRYDQAFAYAERGKARALVDMLASKQQFGNKVLSGTTLLAGLTEEEKTHSPLTDTADKFKQRAASRALLRKRQQEIQQAQPELASLVTVSAPSIAELQKYLGENETLVEYYGDDKQLYAFVMSKQGVGAVKLNADHVVQTIQDYRAALMQPTSNTHQALGLKLYGQLVAPVVGQIKTTNVTFVPHGALHYLPFSALPTAKANLIDYYSIRVLPSASVMQFLNKQRQAKGTLLALGNPDLNDKSLDLPGAQVEATAIVKQQPHAQLLLRNKATETAVKQYGGAYKYLHFASHGVFDPDKPLQSGLLLAKDAANDGTLTVGELYDLNLNADLVTLSACETALGKVANGDDVVGFTRGFLYAGANSIVSSLWKVDDAATNQLMQNFYANLTHSDKRSALRAAQLSVKKRYPHPYYWAAFQLTGAVN